MPQPRATVSPARGVSGRSRALLLLVGGLVLVLAAFALTRAGQASPTTGSQPASTKQSQGQGSKDPESGLVWVNESALNPQARETLAAIRAGGPFRYPKNDGVTFENREGVLPAEAKGYYSEYTVVTPGSPDRGPRRIVMGKDAAKYYTGDHYDSFQRIREGS